MSVSRNTPDRQQTVGHQPNHMPLHAAQVGDALLRIKDAAQLTKLSTATLYRLAASDPTFPKLIKLGARCTRIKAGDLSAWIAAQAKG